MNNICIYVLTCSAWQEPRHGAPPPPAPRRLRLRLRHGGLLQRQLRGGGAARHRGPRIT